MGKTFLLYSALSVGIGALGLTLLEIDPQTFISLFSEVANNEIAQAGFFFTVAAWIHSGRVKKEIAKNFAHLTDAINNVAKTLREDLEQQSKRLDSHGQRLENLEAKIK